MSKIVLVTLAVVIACHYLVDVPVALAVQEVLYGNRHWVSATNDLPDLLLPVVVLLGVWGWTVYFIRKRKGLTDVLTDLALVVGWAAPASFLCKVVLKVVFGRVNTRVWLTDTSLYGFHWFQGGGNFNGFPSGHMVVFSTVAAVLWRICPRYRWWYATTLLLLAVALVATNYHFVGDVVAGTVTGILVAMAVHGLLRRRQLVRLP